MEKYQNKYRIPSARLQTWNYGSNAPYFVTICTHGRECFFGNIVETPKLGVSNTLSPIGQLAQKYWAEIPNHFPFVKLGAFVVMPNHVHGIIIIDNPANTPNLGDISVQTPKLGVCTKLGTIINQYKRAVTIGARHINPVFAWQSRFHDHIIRDDRSFHNISNYINRNPQNWKGDKFCN